MIRLQKKLENSKVCSIKNLSKVLQNFENFLIDDLLIIAKEEYKDKIKVLWKTAGLI